MLTNWRNPQASQFQTSERRVSRRERALRRSSSSTAAPKSWNCSRWRLDAGRYDIVFVESNEHAYRR